jgi:hypothetical protein
MSDFVCLPGGSVLQCLEIALNILGGRLKGARSAKMARADETGEAINMARQALD